MKKLLATVLLSSSFALCSCDPGMKVGGGIVIDGSELPKTEMLSERTFSVKKHAFKYYDVYANDSNDLIFGVNGSYLESTNGIPDALLSFKNGYGVIVYGIRSDQSVEQISVSYYDEENEKNHYVLAGYGYENFRIEYCIAPGEQNPTPVNIGTLSFYC